MGLRFFGGLDGAAVIGLTIRQYYGSNQTFCSEGCYYGHAQKVLLG